MDFLPFSKMKKAVFIIPAVLLIATFLAGFSLVRFLERVGESYLRQQSKNTMEAMAQGIQNDLHSLENAVSALAGSPWISPALLDSNSVNIENANSVLDRYNKEFKFSVCYLMDLSGNVIASSNRNEPNSFVGKNYAFRPYFQKALQKEISSYLATGVTDRERGFYAAHTIQDSSGKVRGVVAIKMRIATVKGILTAYKHSFMVSPEGVIFISGDPQMVLKTLWPLTAEQKRALADSKQFNIPSFEPVFPSPIRDGGKIRFQHAWYEFFQQPVAELPGWSLALLEPAQSVLHFVLFGWIITVFFGIILGILTLWTIFHIRDRELLKASEEKHRFLVENSHDIIYTLTLEGVFTFVSPSWTAFLGHSVNQVLGKHFQEFVHPDDLAACKAFLQKGIKTGQRQEGIEYRVRHIDGSWKWHTSSGSALKDENGKVIGIEGIARDITRGKQAETELLKFQRAIEQSPATAVITDLAGAIEYVNPKFTETTGYTFEEALGKNPRILKSGELSEKVYKELWEVIISGGEWRGEFHNKKKNGELYWEFASISPVRDTQGIITHFLAVKEDITERKRVEFALEEKTKELELQSWGLQKANDGIKSLYQELEKKNTDLAKLNRLKDDFVSIVAHELRNPLGVVREAAALILEGLLGPVSKEQKEYLEMIERTGDRLLHITTDLLDLAKIEAGKIVVNYETMDLLSLLRQACEGIALRANKKGLTVSQVFPEGKLEISGDFDKLFQVVNNLLSNAFKFTEKGGITVEASDLGQEVRCTVKDTGRGISRENISRLFSKFEQFGKPAVSTEKGSGLGLVISKSIVEAHGGKIWAESEPGQGTSFIITLPKQHQRKQSSGEILVKEKMLAPEQAAEALRKQNEKTS